jgi:hypothetical protein
MSEKDPFGLDDLLDKTTPPPDAEFMGEAGLQVTGQARMEAAYGSR